MSELTIKATDSVMYIKVFCIIWIYFYFADFVIDDYNVAN